MIEVDYNEYKETIEENMRLIPENHKLKEEIERLNNKIFLLDSEKEMLRKETIEWEEDCKRAYNIINKAIEYLESYNTDFKNCRFGEAPISIRELGDLLDILKGSDKE